MPPLERASVQLIDLICALAELQIQLDALLSGERAPNVGLRSPELCKAIYEVHHTSGAVWVSLTEARKHDTLPSPPMGIGHCERHGESTPCMACYWEQQLGVGP